MLQKQIKQIVLNCEHLYTGLKTEWTENYTDLKAVKFIIILQLQNRRMRKCEQRIGRLIG